MNTKRKAKIVATIGPASQSEEVLRSLIKAGLNVARLNFSHGDYSFFEEVLSPLDFQAIEGMDTEPDDDDEDDEF